MPPPKWPWKAFIRPIVSGGRDEAEERRCVIGLRLNDANQRRGEEVRQVRGHADGAAARAAATMRHREGLVQIEMHQIEAQLGRANDSQEGIEVGAIAVHQSTAVVDQFW